MNRILGLYGRTSLGLLVGALAVAGCSGDEPLPDAGMVNPDAAPPADAGVRALCPIPENNPACQDSSECGEVRSVPSNCEFCSQRQSSDFLCKLGQCEEPPILDGTQSMEFNFNAPDLEQFIESFVRVAVTSETSGGDAITCEMVLAEQLDLTQACYNVIDIRFNMAGDAVAGAYKLLFSRIPSGQRTLLVVYAFGEEGAMGAPIGVSCAEVDVPLADPNGMTMPVDGGDMTSLR